MIERYSRDELSRIARDLLENPLVKHILSVLKQREIEQMVNPLASDAEVLAARQRHAAAEAFENALRGLVDDARVAEHRNRRQHRARQHD